MTVSSNETVDPPSQSIVTRRDISINTHGQGCEVSISFGTSSATDYSLVQFRNRTITGFRAIIMIYGVTEYEYAEIPSKEHKVVFP